VKVPALLLLKVTDIVGVMEVPKSLSVTVAVQTVGALTGTFTIEHASEVIVLRWTALRLNVPELAVWSRSEDPGLYLPVIMRLPSEPGLGV